MPQYQGIWTLQDAARLQSQQQWATDPLFDYTTLLLQADNAPNAAQNNTFLDSSANAFTITRNGNTTQGTFTPFSATGWSAYLVSSGSTLAGVYLNGESDFAFNGDFTIEFFVNLASSGASQILYDQRPALTNGVYPTIYLDNSVTKLKFYVNGADRIVQTSTFTYNVWHHVVVTRTSTSTKMFIDGVQEGSTYTDTNSYLNVSLRPYTSNGYAPDSGVVGYISNLRVVKGSGPYQSAGSTISVPTAQLTPVTNTVLLTLQSNRYVDTNTQAAPKTVNAQNAISIQPFAPFAPQFQYTPTVIGGSGYFDGTTDYLTQTTGQQVSFGTADFTIEAWMYFLSTEYPTQAGIMFGNGVGWTIYIFPSNRIQWGNISPQTPANLLASSSTITTGQWYHVAITRLSGTVTMWINGVSNGTVSNPANFSASGSLTVGIDHSNDEFFGYMSDVRVVKGTALYTSTFAPPTAPLTAVSGTSVLYNFTNAAITDGTMKNNLETVGNAQVSTSIVKYGAGSMAFDGSGDYLTSNVGIVDLYAFNTGDFTIEMWVYFNSVASVQCVYDSRPSSTQGAYPLIYLNSDGTLRYFVSSADRITSSALSASTWYHVAVSRINGSTRLFINGTQAGSTYTDSTSYLNASGRPWVGINAFTTNTQGLNGYIDDLRVTKGVARYISNFTPPQVALPRQ